jgi:phospholipid transport system transporter-binding protein
MTRSPAEPKTTRVRIATVGEGRLRVDGALDFVTVGPLLAQGAALMPRSGQLRIDLGGVESANSAGLALLLEWMDLAQARGVDLRYLDMPESLTRIAAFSNLGTLLPTDTKPDRVAD